MTYAHYEQDGFVATVTIDRQEVLNALDDAVLADLDEAVNQVDLDQTRCLIITGAGNRAFVAGADIARMSTMTRQEAAAFGTYGNAVFRRIEKLPVPTIAAINGYALGGGCELALACDLRIASVKAKLGQPEILLGIIPGGGGTQRLPRLVGPAKAKDLILSGRQVGAEEALAMGLVDEVVEHDALHDRALALAAEYARGPVAAHALAKRAIDRGLDSSLASGLDLEQQLFVEVFGTNDARIGVESFREHGPGHAEFTGK